jgi:hypothetical protein
LTKLRPGIRPKTSQRWIRKLETGTDPTVNRSCHGTKTGAAVQALRNYVLVCTRIQVIDQDYAEICHVKGNRAHQIPIRLLSLLLATQVLRHVRIIASKCVKDSKPRSASLASKLQSASAACQLQIPVRHVSIKIHCERVGNPVSTAERSQAHT